LLALQYIDLLCLRHLEPPIVEEFVKYSPDSSKETLNEIKHLLIHVLIPTIIPQTYAKLFPSIEKTITEPIATKERKTVVIDLTQDNPIIQIKQRMTSGVFVCQIKSLY
jgi:hypothetical protein